MGLRDAQLVVTTPRLILREFRKSDWEAVHPLRVRPGSGTLCTFGPKYRARDEGVHQARRPGIGESGPRLMFDFAVVRQADDRLIGSCSLYIRYPKAGWRRSATYSTRSSGDRLRNRGGQWPARFRLR